MAISIEGDWAKPTLCLTAGYHLTVGYRQRQHERLKFNDHPPLALTAIYS